ncbi:hypothetical protein GGS24DRAFT_512672 [Hypoxylon argillaceum]|nr:hypothetical protein GGS24DRAFT_512672 [Hypoxylon argillaceum]
MSASFTFLSDLPLYQTEKPYTVYGQAPPQLRPSNCEFTTVAGITVENIRGKEQEFSLSRDGFQYILAPSALSPEISDFLHQDALSEKAKAYLTETTSIAKKFLIAEKAICFDWRIRSSASDLIAGESILRGSRSDSLAPATIVHSGWHFLAKEHHAIIKTFLTVSIDYSFEGGLERMRRQLSQEEISLFNFKDYQVRIVNIWRPLVDVVRSSPLAFCHPATVSPDSVLEEDKVHPDHWEEGLFLLYRPSQKWYWLSLQSKDEIAIFRTWDSDSPTALTCPPHASFSLPGEDSIYNTRKSIEVRILVFSKRENA